MCLAHGVETDHPERGQVLLVATQVPGVPVEGVARGTPLDRQVVEVVGDEVGDSQAAPPKGMPCACATSASITLPSATLRPAASTGSSSAAVPLSASDTT